jgi:hypothetical protein
LDDVVSNYFFFYIWFGLVYMVWFGFEAVSKRLALAAVRTVLPPRDLAPINFPYKSRTLLLVSSPRLTRHVNLANLDPRAASSIGIGESRESQGRMCVPLTEAAPEIIARLQMSCKGSDAMTWCGHGENKQIRVTMLRLRAWCLE